MALFFRRLKKRLHLNTSSRPVNTVYGRAPQRVPCSIPAYVLVVDESGSTATPLRMGFGRNTTRIRAIQLAAQDYLRHLKASNPMQLVGIVGFSDTASLYHPISPVGRAQGHLFRALQSLHPKAATNLSAGLDVALGQIHRAHTCRGNIVLITDGSANVETERLPGLTSRARSMRVRIYTIGVGNNGDGDYDRELLSHMARATGGRFMSAHSYQALCNALRKAC